MFLSKLNVCTILCFLLNCVQAPLAIDPPKLTGYTDMVVDYGQSLEIFCTGRAKKLKITISGKQQTVEIMNTTTIRFVADRPDRLPGRRIECSDKDTKSYDFLRFVVNIAEKPVNFRCISRNLKVLNCSWTTMEPLHPVNVTLFSIINGSEDPPSKIQRDGNRYFCTWYTDRGLPLYRNRLETFVFMLRTETIYGSAIETFVIDHFANVKLDPPRNLKVLRTTTYGAVLAWSIPDEKVDLLPNGVDHRIEYRSVKTRPGRINKSSLPEKPSRNNTYQFGVILPCAGQLYNLNISIKPRLRSQAGIWSDSVAINFSTEAEINAEIQDDPSCEPRESPEIMMWQIRNLIRTFRNENSKIKESIRLLKQRAAAVEAVISDQANQMLA